ncbi:uncharacterized protein LOC130453177 [Diorhabda sublineata]|uniref:uncharacterized protein LOC130453177 n=1 Tax=Diorhabda sublineata TaxID=1163346 RepID=UPI0024E16B7A|nr:uncharacterized protein LOC130453177 [Diorhabda sublineata]
MEIDGHVIQQVLKFRYLGIDITSYGDVENEVRQQVVKTNKVAGCLNSTIWVDKHLTKETKSRIYETTISLIMTYTAKTRTDATKTKILLEITEMKVLRKIAGKITLLDRESSENKNGIVTLAE